MKDVLLFMRAVLITPIVIAIGTLLILMSYLVYPVIILVGIFSILKADEHTDKDDEDHENDWAKPDRHK